MTFSKGFFWGSATAAYQIEGGINNNWTKFFDAGQACDSYNRFQEDFDIAKSLGHNAHRFSIEWSRVEPEQGKFNEKEIKHYQKVIDALRKRNIEPFVTLWHFTNPLWVKDISQWGNYINKITKSLKGVNFWITINEPEIYSINSYLKGLWPPKKKNFISYLLMLKKFIKAHKQAYKIIKGNQPNAKIGIAKNNIYFEGWPISFFDNWWWNEFFLNKIKNEQDFIGLNYYFHRHFPKNENKEVSDMGWEIYPEGIYHVLKNLKKYNKPVYITENGIADSKDIKRAKFITDHLRWVEKAIGERVDVRGYFYWSLLDNFEWAHGFGPRFGLVEMDYKTMERKIRPSAREYKKIIENNGL